MAWPLTTIERKDCRTMTCPPAAAICTAFRPCPSTIELVGCECFRGDNKCSKQSVCPRATARSSEWHSRRPPQTERQLSKRASTTALPVLSETEGSEGRIGRVHFPSRRRAGAKMTAHFCIYNYESTKAAASPGSARHRPERIIDSLQEAWELNDPEAILWVTGCLEGMAK